MDAAPPLALPLTLPLHLPLPRFLALSPVFVVAEQVSPRFTHTGAVAALHKLRALQFVKHRHRHESDAVAVDLDLSFDCDEVGSLPSRFLHAVFGSLPNCSKTSRFDFAAVRQVRIGH